MSTTPNGARVIALPDDHLELGAEGVDVTEGVKALYDLVLGSMNWSSGFWTAEDAAPVSVIGHACGFAEVEKVDQYIAVRQHQKEASEWPDRPHYDLWDHRCDNAHRHLHMGVDPATVEHEHVLSSVGRCMWPQCTFGRDL